MVSVDATWFRENLHAIWENLQTLEPKCSDDQAIFAAIREEIGRLLDMLTKEAEK